MSWQVDKEQERYSEWLEENPPIEGDGGWICPKCEYVHRCEEDAANCCMPDEQDYDDFKHHNK